MSELQSSTESSGTQRAGYVALVGRPNAGKSTLLNRFIGEKLSIVTSKAQTTWQRVTGIVTSDDTQMIFLDTPGLLEARDLLQESMVQEAMDALADADVTVLVLDARRMPDATEARSLVTVLSATHAPVIVALNKMDTIPDGDVARLTQEVKMILGAEPHAISALQGQGVDALRSAIESALPVGPFLYPADEIASAPVRFFVGELIRETVFERFHKEIPYAVFCQVEDYREAQDPVYIQANIFVENKSQKRIIIGSKGAAIRDLGSAARKKIEHFIGSPVYLDLWVKVLPKWRRESKHLREFGMKVPHEES